MIVSPIDEDENKMAECPAAFTCELCGKYFPHSRGIIYHDATPDDDTVSLCDDCATKFEAARSAE